MKTNRSFRVDVALLFAGMGLICWGPVAKSQEESGQQEKRAAEMAVLALPNIEAGDAQEAQQKVMLEVVAADAQVVKGKPYSADTTTETVQTLADGNHIVHRTVSKIYRDSDGRTRREQTFGNIDPEHPSPHEVKVFIDDPTNGTAFVLDPGSKSVDNVMRKRTFVYDRKTEDEAKGTIFKETEDAQENGPVRMMVKFRDEHSGGALAAVVPDEKRKVTTEDLGARNIEGVDCTGTRQTITILAGAIGNEKPISIVRETWFAPVISAVVESITDDPRYGKTTYQLKNVQLNEPSRSMFELPADFKVNVRK
jgi:hypothetical protein